MDGSKQTVQHTVIAAVECLLYRYGLFLGCREEVLAACGSCIHSGIIRLTNLYVSTAMRLYVLVEVQLVA